MEYIAAEAVALSFRADREEEGLNGLPDSHPIAGKRIKTRMRQFESFSASELYCPKCRSARPVYERLLLVLPRKEIYDIRCRACGTSLGQREARAPSLNAQLAAPPVAPPKGTSRAMPTAGPRGKGH